MQIATLKYETISPNCGITSPIYRIAPNIYKVASPIYKTGSRIYKVSSPTYRIATPIYKVVTLICETSSPKFEITTPIYKVSSLFYQTATQTEKQVSVRQKQGTLTINKTTYWMKWTAPNTRLCSPAGWRAFRRFCARIHFVAGRQWSSRKPQDAHSLGR